MTMRERMARAIHPRAWSRRMTSGPAKAGLQQEALEAADRALDAILEPTEAMLEEGAYLTPDSQGGEGPIQPDVTRSIWQAMIDAAKEER